MHRCQLASGDQAVVKYSATDPTYIRLEQGIYAHLWSRRWPLDPMGLEHHIMPYLGAALVNHHEAIVMPFCSVVTIVTVQPYRLRLATHVAKALVFLHEVLACLRLQLSLPDVVT